MRLSKILPRLLAAALLSWVTGSASAAIYQDIIEVPLPSAAAPTGGLFGQKTAKTGEINSPVLSERYNATREGKRYERRTDEKFPGETNRVIIYKCLPVLAMSNGSNTEVIIDVVKQRVYLMVNGLMGLETQVSTARSDKVTPRGAFEMTERVRDGKISNLYDVEMPFWMRLSETEFGVHAGYLPGYPASAGCIRLPEPTAEIVFDNTKRGSPVRVLSSWRAPALPSSQPAGGSSKPARRPGGKTPDGLEVDEYGQTIRRIKI